MYELLDPVGRHTPADDATDVTLVSFDQLGESIGFALSDATDKFALLA
jgi:hypothetical protein